MGGNYKLIETRLESAIHLRFSPACITASKAKDTDKARRSGGRFL